MATRSSRLRYQTLAAIANDTLPSRRSGRKRSGAEESRDELETDRTGLDVTTVMNVVPNKRQCRVDSPEASRSQGDLPDRDEAAPAIGTIMNYSNAESDDPPLVTDAD
eukprot:3080008-Prymnesium_polylepis.1